jgi:YD repeat-containing protein
MKKTLTWLLLSAFALSLFANSASAAPNYRYEYDGNNRLTHVFKLGGSMAYEFKYDKNGNLLKTDKLDLITSMTATGGTNTATLTWTIPSNSHTGFKVYKNGVYVTTIGKVTTYSFSNLAAGTYTLGITPIFATGDGEIATKSVQVTDPTPPPTGGDTGGGGGGRITPGDPDPAS